MKIPNHSILINYAVSTIIIVATMLVVAWYATDRFHQFFVAEQQHALVSRAITIRESNHSVDKLRCNVLSISDPKIRVTIVASDGRVYCDSLAESSKMENHGNRPEIVAALKGQQSDATRFSATLQTTMLYVAVPYYYANGQTIKGVIRTAVSLSSIENLLKDFYKQLALLIVVLLAVIFIVMINVYKKINQPLAEIIAVANNYAKGDFTNTLPNYEIVEIEEIGGALNRMAEQLSRLENLRQDFVANVSHELKTPIATIKSYAETLLDGAQHNPKDVEHFLNVISKQNNRLGDIVDDLLMLSRLETAPKATLLNVQNINAIELIKSALEICQVRAAAKNIKLNYTGGDNLAVNVDHSLMIQAIVNLIDNAIKYSPKNSAIKLSLISQNHLLTINISDQGPGIDEAHIPRLFERFYRIDKSRSRREGGTGLGLAIVKHIVQIHGGNIAVKNNTAGGCRFYIALPKV